MLNFRIMVSIINSKQNLHNISMKQHFRISIAKERFSIILYSFETCELITLSNEYMTFENGSRSGYGVFYLKRPMPILWNFILSFRTLCSAPEK